MMKNVVLLLLTVLSYSIYGQTLYFKLKDSEPKAEIVSDHANFYQSELTNLLVNYDVKPVLRHPEKFHSIYADRLSRTYMVNLQEVSAQDLDFFQHQLSSKSVIEYVEVQEEPILVSCPSNDPSDAAWNLSRHEITCVQEAHCITTGDPSIIIAARDNGFIAGHPEHAGQVVYVEPGAYDGDCHGTKTSITSAGATDNGFGISSSGYDCSLALYRWNDFIGDYEDMILRGIRVVHNSYINSCSHIQAHQNVINLVSEQGLIVVGSAGNGNGGANCGGVGNNNATYPSALDNVISVSSVSSGLCCETTYNFWGDPYDPPLHHTHNETVDLLAQGYAVVSGNCNGGGQSISYGTSIAGPHIAGIIGLMLSVNPCLNHDDALSILQSTGQDVTNVCNNSSYYPNGAPPVPCAESAVLAAQTYIGPDLVINSNTDWDQKFVSGNVIIKSGATLTIHGVASMSTNSKIIVEEDADLIIDGGLITSCHEEWQGIVVEGDRASGNQDHAGRVKLQNDAIIENAKTAISMNPSHLGWPTVSQHWGGLVEGENSTFRNCRRAVEFMKYGTGFIEDKSYFRNVSFEDIKSAAVTIWSNNNVTFEECNFENIADRGIYALDSEVIVRNHCTFTSQPIGVDILTTYPIPFSSRIGDVSTSSNDFLCERYGVFAQSQGNVQPLHVVNNNFLDGLYGVHINGMANFAIHHNDMNEGFSGVEAVSTGNHGFANIVSNNTISNMSYGSHAAFKNGGMQYVENCFDFSTFADIYVNNGSIFVEQGSAQFANGNCFTKGGVPEIDNSGNPPIKLWVWENEPISSCRYPSLIVTDPSYDVLVDKGALSNPKERCGILFFPEGHIVEENIYEEPQMTQAELFTRISEVEQEITSIESNSVLSQEYKDYLKTIYSRSLYQLQNNVMSAILEPDTDDSDGLNDNSQRLEAAIIYASELPLFSQKILAYGLLVNSGQIDRARKYINELEALDVSQTNFIKVQNINLDYLLNVYEYSLSKEDSLYLLEAGAGKEPLDGYARSVYELITGQRIWLDTPDPRNRIRPRSSQGAEQKSRFNVFPNPSHSGFVNVVVPDIEDGNLCSFQIADLYGKILYARVMNEGIVSINTENIESGTYIITVLNPEGDIMHLEKVIILK